MNTKQLLTQANRLRRKKRTRNKVQGTTEQPRLAVKRSLRYVSVQVIDDQQNKTLLALAEKDLNLKGDKTARAAELGKQLAEKLKAAKINKVVFDRGAYKYHGRVKALADGVREGGIQF